MERCFLCLIALPALGTASTVYDALLERRQRFEASGLNYGIAGRGVQLRSRKGEESGLHGVWVKPDREGVARSLETIR